jgi:hypothetical protein
MQTRDDQMIFEQYQQIDEISIPFSGGKQFGVMNRFKKMLPGQWGKKAKAGINIESDVNHFIELLNNLAHTTGDSTEAIIKSPNFSEWVKRTIKVDTSHIPNWDKLVKSGEINQVINAAIIQRNKDYAYGVGNKPADKPEFAGDSSLPATGATPQAGNSGAPGQSNAPQAPQPTGVDQTPNTPQSTGTAQSPNAPASQASAPQLKPGKALAKYATEVAEKIKSIYKDKRAMTTAVPKFLDSVSKQLGIAPAAPAAAAPATANKSSKFNTTANIPVKGKQQPIQSTKVPTKGKQQSKKGKIAKESIYIASNVITEDIQFIDCSKF